MIDGCSGKVGEVQNGGEVTPRPDVSERISADEKEQLVRVITALPEPAQRRRSVGRRFVTQFQV